jgi:hypothetical protein
MVLSLPLSHRTHAWVWIVGGIFLACVPAREGNAPRDHAHQVLAGARRALGSDSAVSATEGVFTVAQVEGPDSRFETLVWSARDGRMRMEQTTGFVGAVDHVGGWAMERESGEIAPLDSQVGQFMRGHELHALVLMPMTRLQDPTLEDAGTWDGDSALIVRHRDPYGTTVLAAYAVDDTLPLGLLFTAPEPDVLVRLGAWSDTGAVRVFRRADFVQGAEVYRYVYTTVQLDRIPDSVFADPARDRRPSAR